MQTKIANIARFGKMEGLFSASHELKKFVAKTEHPHLNLDDIFGEQPEPVATEATKAVKILAEQIESHANGILRSLIEELGNDGYDKLRIELDR